MSDTPPPPARPEQPAPVPQTMEELMDLLPTIVTETVEKTGKEHPGMTGSFGTVKSCDGDSNSPTVVAMVAIDGDNGAVTPVTSLEGPVPVDARVFVIWVPPQGVYILGVLTANRVPGGAISQIGCGGGGGDGGDDN